MTTWVLLRGLTREAAHWGVFAEQFAQAVAPDAVLWLDLPGNGHFHATRSPATVQAMLRCCRQQLVHRGIDQPVHVVAMSLGAMVAAQWMFEAPHELARCVLINTSLRPYSRFYQRLRPANYLALARLVLLPTSARQCEQTVLRLTSNDPVAQSRVLPGFVSVRQLRPVSPGNALRQLWAAARYRVTATQAPAPPSLVLASVNDHLVSVQCSRELARAWGVRCDEHPWAGHDLPLDDPAWVIQRVLAWCGRETTAA